jgi:hypothetical protein
VFLRRSLWSKDGKPVFGFQCVGNGAAVGGKSFITAAHLFADSQTRAWLPGVDDCRVLLGHGKDAGLFKAALDTSSRSDEMKRRDVAVLHLHQDAAAALEIDLDRPPVLSERCFFAAFHPPLDQRAIDGINDGESSVVYNDDLTLRPRFEHLPAPCIHPFRLGRFPDGTASAAIPVSRARLAPSSSTLSSASSASTRKRSATRMAIRPPLSSPTPTPE